MNRSTPFAWRFFFLCTAMLGLAACAGVPAVDWERGARPGKIVEIIDLEAPVASLPPCIAGQSPKPLADRHFARVLRFGVRAAHTDVAEIAPGVPLAVGTAVEVFPGNCAAGKLGWVPRALPQQ